jgi:hypothetical protein
MRVGLILLGLGGTPALAAPTYLQCPFVGNGGASAVLAVTADEANGAVTTLMTSTGYTERRVAVFSPISGKWNSPSRYTTLRYELSRTDLTLVRELVIGDHVTKEIASCKIQETPKRAF